MRPTNPAPNPACVPPLPRRVQFGLGAVLALLAAVYLPSLSAPFVYDDVLSIPGNPSLRQLWPPSALLVPDVAPGATVAGRPLLNVSFALNQALGGPTPASFRFVNLLIHAGATLLLFGFVRRTLLRLPATAARAAPLALAVAALWSLHPLQTQAVTYIVQRAESLTGLFYLATLYATARALPVRTASPAVPAFPAPPDLSAPPAAADPAPRASGEAQRHLLRDVGSQSGFVSSPQRHVISDVVPGWAAVAAGACAAGMATKEVMVTAPLLVLLYDRTFAAGSLGAALRRRPGFYAALAATWGLLALVLLTTGGNRGGTVGLGTGLSLWAYPLTQFEALATYLRLAVWPHPLVFEYGTFWVRGFGEALPYALLVLPLLAATGWALLRRPAAGFAGAAFFVVLAPTSLAPGTIQMTVEHRVYLPLAAVITLAVLAAARVPRVATPIVVPLVLALALVTADRNRDYGSTLTLWQDTVAKRPLNPRAHEGVAEALEAAGRFAEAVTVRETSVRLAPHEPRFRFNLALALTRAGQTDAAIAAYREVLRAAPDEARAHNNLAQLLGERGDTAAAFSHYATAVRLAPHEPAYAHNQGLALLRAGRPEEALVPLAAAARSPAAAPEHLLSYAATLGRLGRTAEAIPVLERAVGRHPDHALLRFQLAEQLLESDRAAAAVPHYEAALRGLAERAEAHHNLGTAYAQLERWDDARRAFDTALRLRPDYPEARRNRERLRQLTGR